MHGIPFKKGRVNHVGRETEIAIYGGKHLALANMGKANRIILFDNAQEKEEFEKSLQNTPLDLRIKLALANGKLSLGCATKPELEAMLP